MSTSATRSTTRRALSGSSVTASNVTATNVTPTCPCPKAPGFSQTRGDGQPHVPGADRRNLRRARRDEAPIFRRKIAARAAAAPYMQASNSARVFDFVISTGLPPQDGSSSAISVIRSRSANCTPISDRVAGMFNRARNSMIWS